MAIERAKTDLARLQREIARLESQLFIAKGRATKLEHYLEVASEYGEDADSETRAFRQENAKRHLTEIAIEILREEKKPLRTRDLIERIEKLGILVPGKDPVANLSSMLSRSDELMADRTAGWSLKAWADALERSTTAMAGVRAKGVVASLANEPESEWIDEPEVASDTDRPNDGGYTASPSAWGSERARGVRPTVEDLDDEIPF